MEDLGWRLGNYEYCGPNLVSILAKPQEGRKQKPSPALPVAIRKTSRTHSMGFKSVGGLLFFFPLFFFLFLFFSSSKWDNKMWSYERSRDRFKEGAHGQPQTKKLRQMSLCYPIELAFYCLFVLLLFFIIFTSFILLVFFFISLLYVSFSSFYFSV